MTRTRTLLILGVFMLSLAVLAGLEWNINDPVRTEGQMVTGALDKTVLPLPEKDSSLSTSLPETSTASNGVFVPLDNGTLRGESGSSLDMTGMRGNSGQPLASAVSAASPSAPSAVEQVPSADTESRGSTAPNATAAPVPLNTPAPSIVSDVATSTMPALETEKVASRETAENRISSEPVRKERVAQRPARAGEFVLTARAPKLAAGQKGASSQLTVGKSVMLQVKGTDTLKTKTLLLRNPDRFVVDLEGNWGIGIPQVPDGLWLKDIRQGRNNNMTRIVFDLARKPTSTSVQNVDARTVEIEIH